MSSDVVVAMGTRPEAIKLAGVVRSLGDHARVIHTGQHYDPQMWREVIRDLPGLDVAHSISVGGRSRGEQIGAATEQITRYLIQEPPAAVVVQGDTNSTLAGTLAALSLDIPAVHVEAGLRSFDRSMPEETNRILVDAVASLCCAPVEANAQQLRKEGVTDDRIVVTGNTLADALRLVDPNPAAAEDILRTAGVSRNEGYVLTTLHRAALVDQQEVLENVLQALCTLARQVTVILPLHPHTAARVKEFGLSHLLDELRVIPPTTPREFMALEAGAALIVSDSGGVQEEACLLRRPLLVLRDSTERPELLDGWCRLLGSGDPQEAVMRAWQDSAGWATELTSRTLPYQSENASDMIVDQIRSRWLS